MYVPSTDRNVVAQGTKAAGTADCACYFEKSFSTEI